MMSILHLPDEILHAVFEVFDPNIDKLTLDALILTNKRFHRIAEPLKWYRIAEDNSHLEHLRHQSKFTTWHCWSRQLALHPTRAAFVKEFDLKDTFHGRPAQLSPKEQSRSAELFDALLETSNLPDNLKKSIAKRLYTGDRDSEAMFILAICTNVKTLSVGYKFFGELTKSFEALVAHTTAHFELHKSRPSLQFPNPTALPLASLTKLTLFRWAMSTTVESTLALLRLPKLRYLRTSGTGRFEQEDAELASQVRNPVNNNNLTLILDNCYIDARDLTAFLTACPHTCALTIRWDKLAPAEKITICDATAIGDVIRSYGGNLSKLVLDTSPNTSRHKRNGDLEMSPFGSFARMTGIRKIALTQRVLDDVHGADNLEDKACSLLPFETEELYILGDNLSEEEKMPLAKSMKRKGMKRLRKMVFLPWHVHTIDDWYGQGMNTS
jgi:hypothetical protein